MCVVSNFLEEFGLLARAIPHGGRRVGRCYGCGHDTRQLRSSCRGGGGRRLAEADGGSRLARVTLVCVFGQRQYIKRLRYVRQATVAVSKDAPPIHEVV